ncbi:ring-cleaving dioxygenase [Sporolactobacillus sp. THM7-4]|nr:ring-cleaving dioxygenase [Sporolactobacillus sp. THM7-4]
MVIKGIHHVSIISGSAEASDQFYSKQLGMRLVKKSVNQDDTSLYHLFYGDNDGSPGTQFTVFEIPMSEILQKGNNSISALSLRVSNDDALHFWQRRFGELGVSCEEIKERAGRKTLAFHDPEGQRLLLVSDEHNHGVPGGSPWANSPVPEENRIIGLGPVKLTVPVAGPTVDVLTDLLGFRQIGAYPSSVSGQPEILVFETGEGGTGAEVHVEKRDDLPPEQLGRGGVHHVAFRAGSDSELKQWLAKIRETRLPNSGFIDRYYFHSVYFRERNGILFELATDGPGFTIDETQDHLGEKLSLPPFLEPKRAELEKRLRPLDLND